jgi:sterol desaturase/sphingolipid hydroxylase (fatty acid hydroxylase superfamily)
VEAPAAVVALVERLRLLELLRSSVYAVVLLFGIVLIIAFFEWWGGANPRRYFSRHFLNDVAYSLFYRGGFYQMFLAAAITNALSDRLGFLRVDLLAALPLPVGAVLFWIAADFLGYWNHRWQHHSRFLWAFHSVHHAQEQLSPLSSYRLHPVEQLITNVVMVAPLLVLGMPTKTWLPLFVFQYGLEFVQHADLRWRYGALYGVLVSPTFHAFHHSTDRAHYDRNFGKILSLWDFVFGTAVSGERPVRFGVDGLVIPERLGAQFVAPFRQLLRSRSRVDVSRSAAVNGTTSVG